MSDQRLAAARELVLYSPAPPGPGCGLCDVIAGALEQAGFGLPGEPSLDETKMLLSDAVRAARLMALTAADGDVASGTPPV